MDKFVSKLWNNTLIRLITLTVVFAMVFFLNHELSNRLGIYLVDRQNVYYFFSTAAQSIATFIAFLIAGYALVYQAMDNLENKDDTLSEIHHKIKSDYYNTIRNLSFTTGISIILCLLIIWLNGYDSNIKGDLAGITIILIIGVIITALWFVINIIDPDKIKKAALKLLEENYEKTDDNINLGTFLETFIELERTIRSFIEANDNLIEDRRILGRNRQNFLPFGLMIELLFRNRLISGELYENLISINRYRNLVAHGHLEQVDRHMFENTQMVLSQINEIAENLRN